MFRAGRHDRFHQVVPVLLLSASISTSVDAQTLNFGPSGSGGSGTWDNTTANWFNGSGALAWPSGATGVFAGTAGTVTVSGTVAVGGMTFSTSGYSVTGGTLTLSAAASTVTTNAGVSTTINSAIAGSSGLVKSGAGTLTLSGANTYTGATVVDAGRLILSNASGFTSATAVNSGATLTFTGTTSVTTAAAITLNDGATLEQINPSSYTILTGAVTSTGNTTINVNTSGTGRGLYLDGGLKGSGAVTINAANAGNSVALRNNNSAFSGTLVINGIASATAGVGSGLALGGPATSNVLINTNVVLNGTIELADQGMGSGFLTSTFNLGALSGSGIIVGNRNPTGNFGSTIVLGNTNDSGHFSGRIVRGSGRTNVVGVTKVGTGTQIFSGANSYTGFTNVNAGVLNIRNNTALGSTERGTNVVSGAALQIEGGIAVGAEALTLNGTGIANDGALRNISGNNSYGGPITLGSVVRINSDTGVLTLGTITGAAQDLTLGGAGEIVVTGVLGITSGRLTKDGSGTAILSATNTYTGATIINAGTLQAGAAAGGRAFGTLSAVTLADVAGATLNLDSFDQTIGSLSGGGATGGNVVLGSGTLTMGGSDTSTTFGGAISGTGALVKIGAGTQTLTGANGYTGGTTISAGTLQIGDGGTTGSIVGDVANDSILAFNRSDAHIFDGQISGSGGIRQTGTGVTALTGANSYTGGTTITHGTLQIGNGGTTGSILGDVANAGTLAFNRSDAYTFGGLITGIGAIRQIGSGMTTLTADNSGFAGTTSVEAGTLAVNGRLCGDMNVRAGGRLQGIGSVCTTDNAGVVAPGNSIGTLTVVGNYTGNGGLLEIETALGSDSSPTDRLVVTGSTAGDTTVRVINLGGLGAPTVEGIKIVDVAGVSGGTFTLRGDYNFFGRPAVVGGAYSYLLQKNGVSTPDDGDWYLRSSMTNQPTPIAEPIYQPAAPVIESYARVMLNLNELPTMQQRIGHRFRSDPNDVASTGVLDVAVAKLSPLWVRIEGGHKNLNPTTTARSTLDLDHYTFEGGVDLANVEHGGGRWLVGVVGNYVEGQADIFSLFGNGKVRVTGGGVGGTVTWLGDTGFYFDGQGRVSWYNGSLTSHALGRITSGNDGSGYAFGAEIGHRLGLGGWSVTPQMQLSYSNVEFDTFADRFGAQVSLSKAESLLGRGGFAVNHRDTWRDASGQLTRSDLYAIANVYYEFLDGTAAVISDTTFANKTDRAWGSIGAGGTFSWANDKYALYGEVSYGTSLNRAGDSYRYKGTAGFRVRW